MTTAKLTGILDYAQRPASGLIGVLVLEQGIASPSSLSIGILVVLVARPPRAAARPASARRRRRLRHREVGRQVAVEQAGALQLGEARQVLDGVEAEMVEELLAWCRR